MTQYFIFRFCFDIYFKRCMKYLYNKYLSISRLMIVSRGNIIITEQSLCHMYYGDYDRARANIINLIFASECVKEEKR